MTLKCKKNIKVQIQKLTANWDYDGDLLFQQFVMASEGNTILSFTKYFGFMPLLDISEVYIESRLYELLTNSSDENVNDLLESYFDSVIEFIEEQLDDGGIQHINNDFDWVFETSMDGIVAATFMPQKKGEDQGVCLYFGPDISSEHLKQLINGISEKDHTNCDTSNGCTGA
jgi:hypothetical protein